MLSGQRAVQAGGGTQLVPELARDSLWEGSREDPVSWDPVDRDGFRSRLAQFLWGEQGEGTRHSGEQAGSR